MFVRIGWKFIIAIAKNIRRLLMGDRFGIGKIQQLFKETHGFRPDIGLGKWGRIFLRGKSNRCWYANDWYYGYQWTRERIMSLPGDLIRELFIRARMRPDLNPELHEPPSKFRQIMKCDYDDCRSWARAIVAYQLEGCFYGVPVCMEHAGYAIQVRRVFETDVQIYRLYEKGV
jgi:hypothetical protein